MPNNSTESEALMISCQSLIETCSWSVTIRWHLSSFDFISLIRNQFRTSENFRKIGENPSSAPL